MNTIQGKRQAYADLFADERVSHTNLKDYFTTYGQAIILDRNSDEFKALKAQLKSLDPQKTISREIDRYFRIYTKAETLQREIEDREVNLTGNYFKEGFKIPSTCYRRGLVSRSQ